MNAQLIEPITRAQIWAQRYDRDLADIFAVESELAEAIVGQLRSKLSPEDLIMDRALAMIDAALGNKEQAVTEARRANKLLPIGQDAITGDTILKHLAITYVWCGDKDRALENLSILSKIPSDVNYGTLHLDPVWDSLRGDPRFEKIVASLAPKAASPQSK